MDSLAQQWADKMPPLDDSNPLPGAATFTRQGESGGGGGVRARRVAQDRGRYTGFDDGRFKAARHATAAAGYRSSRMPGDGGGGGGGGYGQGGGGYGGGGGGRFSHGGGGGRRESTGGADERDEGSSRPSGGWADRYKPVEEDGK